ncbi:MAG TPA: PEP-CTERM sorting domain-containing protein [Phycisphaerae bacterium]|nr:PEP-CTERM sorting domain-containing protein [Phycisphaerae bacterium]
MLSMQKTCAALFCIPMAVMAQAGIVGWTGDVQVISPPPSVREGEKTSNDWAFLFSERTGAVLAADLWVDAYQAGFYDAPGDLAGKYIPAGTTVNSYLLHMDQTALFGSSFSGSFTFEVGEQIAGVIVTRNPLDISDSLGAPGVEYPLPGADREFDLNQITGGDDFTIQKSLRTISFNASLWAGLDHMRIITFPEPASLALLIVGVAFGVARRR